MGSKQVLDRQKSSSTVDSAGTKYESKMVESMTAALGPEAGAATKTLLGLATARLKNDTATMIQADIDHLNETSDDTKWVAVRDAKRDTVRTMLMDIRDSAQTVYGPDFARSLGFKGETPEDAVMVESLGKIVLGNLTAEPKTPLKPVKFGVTMDLTAWKEPLSTALAALAAAIRDVVDDTRQADQTLVKKQRSIAQYDRSFSTTAGLISQLLKVAGEDELARRVRPSTRKPGQTVGDEESGTEGGAEEGNAVATP